MNQLWVRVVESLDLNFLSLRFLQGIQVKMPYELNIETWSYENGSGLKIQIWELADDI